MHIPRPGKPLRRIARGDLCAGCGACAGVFPDKLAMAASPPGFLRPEEIGPLNAAEEEEFARFCPALSQIVEAGARTDHILWGLI